MKKFFVIMCTICLVLSMIACSNDQSSKDYNNLTATQQEKYNEIYQDVLNAINNLQFDGNGNVTNAPTGVTVVRTVTYKESGAIIKIVINFTTYLGTINGYTITGNTVLNYNYDSINDPYYSSSSGVFSLTATKDKAYLLSATAEAKYNKTTGTQTSSVEQGTFDGATYRISQ